MTAVIHNLACGSMLSAAK